MAERHKSYLHWREIQCTDCRAIIGYEGWEGDDTYKVDDLTEPDWVTCARCLPRSLTTLSKHEGPDDEEENDL